MNSIDTTPSIARAAMLVNLNITLYTGRKQDKQVQAEITVAKQAHSAKAASVYKNLFADSKELDELVKFQARVRARHYAMTLPWSDMGPRLLPTKAFMDYTAEMSRLQQQFDFLVDAFLQKYDTLVAAAAFKLGTMFDRAEYKAREDIAKRFSFSLSYLPLPTAGDFRLDIDSAIQQQLVSQYEQRLAQQVEQAQRDAWDRMYEVLTQIKDRLTLDENGKRKIFRDTTVTNATDLCEALTALNVMGDPKLEAARQRLEDALMGVEPAELRKEEGERLTVLSKVNSILDSFDFGDLDGE